MKKLICVVGMMFVAAVVMAADAPASKPAKRAAVPASSVDEAWKKKVFTLDELKKFDGKNGRRVYVAVDGVVYDLTNAPHWKGGGHMGKHTAGKDQSDDYHNNAPKNIHEMKKIIETMPKVGVLAPKAVGPVRAPAAAPAGTPAPVPLEK